jgi:hypothetical protein
MVRGPRTYEWTLKGTEPLGVLFYGLFIHWGDPFMCFGWTLWYDRDEEIAFPTVGPRGRSDNGVCMRLLGILHDQEYHTLRIDLSSRERGGAMAQAVVAQMDERIDIRAALPVQCAEMSVAADEILAQALSYCAGKMGLDGPQAVAERVCQGDRAACGYYVYSVAKQVAESVGSLDGNVRAVYTFDCDATPEDECLSEVARGALLVHLLVWTQRKTAALCALVSALDRALVRAYASALGVGQPASLLDVQVIDDVDVGRRSGYGALLGSMYHRPVQVWER